MADAEILRRLDLMQATLQLAFKPQLNAAREEFRSDKVVVAILDETEDWIASAELQKRVSDKAKTSVRTVRNRLPELVADRVLAVQGGARPDYRRMGLV